MRIKNIPIVLCCLIAAGVALMSYTPVQAGVNLGDGICSDTEAKLNYCIKVYDYVIEVLPCDNGEWPCLVADGTMQAFQYRATAPAGCDSPTWSYSITQLEKCDGPVDYILDTDPDGAALSIPNNKVSKCANIENNLDESELWKLNPTLNCSDVTQSIDFTLYTAVDSRFSCGNMTWVRTSMGCEGNLLRGPGCGDIIPASGVVKETSRTYNGGDVQVLYDKCSDDIAGVSFGEGTTAEGKAWICAGGDTANPLKNGGDTSKCSSSAVSAGPDAQGCVIQGSWDVISPTGTAYIRR